MQNRLLIFISLGLIIFIGIMGFFYARRKSFGSSVTPSVTGHDQSGLNETADPERIWNSFTLRE